MSWSGKWTASRWQQQRLVWQVQLAKVWLADGEEQSIATVSKRTSVAPSRPCLSFATAHAPRALASSCRPSLDCKEEAGAKDSPERRRPLESKLNPMVEAPHRLALARYRPAGERRMSSARSCSRRRLTGPEGDPGRASFSWRAPPRQPWPRRTNSRPNSSERSSWSVERTQRCSRRRLLGRRSFPFEVAGLSLLSRRRADDLARRWSSRRKANAPSTSAREVQKRTDTRARSGPARALRRRTNEQTADGGAPLRDCDLRIDGRIRNYPRQTL